MSTDDISHDIAPSAAASRELSPCDVCGHRAEQCLCEPCGQCGDIGNPLCYQEHGMRLRIVQRIGFLEAMIRDQVSNADLLGIHLKLGGSNQGNIRRGIKSLEEQRDRCLDELDSLRDAQKRGLIFLDEMDD